MCSTASPMTTCFILAMGYADGCVTLLAVSLAPSGLLASGCRRGPLHQGGLLGTGSATWLAWLGLLGAVYVVLSWPDIGLLGKPCSEAHAKA